MIRLYIGSESDLFSVSNVTEERVHQQLCHAKSIYLTLFSGNENGEQKTKIREESLTPYLIKVPV